MPEHNVSPESEIGMGGLKNSNVALGGVEEGNVADHMANPGLLA